MAEYFLSERSNVGGLGRDHPGGGQRGELGFFYTCIYYSVVEPETDFLAGAGAGEKAPVPGCCCLA